MNLTRRAFVKQASLLTLGLLLGKGNAFAFQSGLEQKVTINLPAYSLTLTEFIDGNLKEAYTFPVGIGKGSHGRKETPIGTGYISEKRERVVFRYGKSYPHLKIKKGAVIWWTNTFDEQGNPVGYRMPYSKMRGLGMRIRKGSSNYYYNEFVIHSTTDEFTIGAHSSNGCIRVGMEDMLRLYSLVSPGVKQGDLKKPVPVEILYDLVELDQENVMLHANVYHRDIDSVKEFKRKVTKAGLDEEAFDYDKAGEMFASANEELDKAQNQILEILSKHHPHNFVPFSLREQLHRTFKLSGFLKG